MYQNTLFVMDVESHEAVARTIQVLTSAGLQVVRSFDFEDAHSVHTNCPCPYHGSTKCDCQMVVLLVYDQGDQPLTLVVHGHDGRTHLAIADSPLQGSNPNLSAEVLLKLRPVLQMSQGIETNSHGS